MRSLGVANVDYVLVLTVQHSSICELVLSGKRYVSEIKPYSEGAIMWSDGYAELLKEKTGEDVYNPIFTLLQLGGPEGRTGGVVLSAKEVFDGWSYFTRFNKLNGGDILELMVPRHLAIFGNISKYSKGIQVCYLSDLPDQDIECVIPYIDPSWVVSHYRMVGDVVDYEDEGATKYVPNLTTESSLFRTEFLISGDGYADDWRRHERLEPVEAMPLWFNFKRMKFDKFLRYLEDYAFISFCEGLTSKEKSELAKALSSVVFNDTDIQDILDVTKPYLRKKEVKTSKDPFELSTSFN